MSGGWLMLTAAMLQTAVVPMAPVRSLDKGALSDVSATRQVTISDRESWAGLWKAHASTRPLPDVDFTREMVAGVFMGTRPTAGFAVEIAGYRDDGGTLVVMYRETAPPPGAISAQIIISPYHLVAIPKRSGTVTFERMKS